ncbi:hypothetical protein KM043_015904 [Ampulex compressa]|nr:hypothetical protein KM043_015904 [Ampulex compressa]
MALGLPKESTFCRTPARDECRGFWNYGGETACGITILSSFLEVSAMPRNVFPTYTGTDLIGAKIAATSNGHVLRNAVTDPSMATKIFLKQDPSLAIILLRKILRTLFS